MSYEEREGTGKGRPTTARLREVLDRASWAVIVEASPSEADSADLPRLPVTGAEIGELAQRLAVADGGTGGRIMRSISLLGW
ncbi:hypothetical protein QFZ82_007570 [Streptomyces sp. V4I23]|uniref:hypothetical protein n=1 Tax=Streptomyces sp. V4I23 TaxID=3042282 RepID=UPI002783B4DD|nr:hypothetical protein [Streptomyces sp. V4I23]MDQ1013085.1 hypothetical protein [Streptomyces sp. V4I23]